MADKEYQSSRPVLWANVHPGQSASDAIDEMLREGAGRGSRVIGIGSNGPDEGGSWIIDRSIVLPSHTTLMLAGARIVARPGMRNLMLTNEIARAKSGRDEMISVLGDGRSSFDGCADRPPRGTNGIHFCGVNGLWVQGIRIGRTAGWGLRIEDVADVHVRDISFFQDGGHPWQDGVHINGPAERVVINGVTGDFGDDVIAIDAALTQNRGGGAIRGVEVSNVSAHNVHGAAIVRTIAAKGRPVQGVHCINLSLTNSAGKGTDAAIKLGWDGGTQIRSDWELPTPEEHCDITIENVHVSDWEGPVICMYHPAKNLQLRNITATHTGPLFFNLEHEIDGLTLDRVRSTCRAESPTALNTEFLSKLTTGDVYDLATTYDRAFTKSDLAAITFNHARCRSIRLRDIELQYVGGGATAAWPAALRMSCGAHVDDIQLDDVRSDGYPMDVVVDNDAVVGSTGKSIKLP